MQEEIYDLFLEVIDNCEIVYRGDVISKELILGIEMEFLTPAFQDDSHLTQFFLHTGSPCYEAVAFVLCVIGTVIHDAYDDEAEFQIEIGSTVSYDNDLWRYEGLYSGKERSLIGRYVLRNKETGATKYLVDSNSLIPYKGAAKTLSGRGVRTSKNRRDEFLNQICGMESSAINLRMHSSVVLLMNENKMDDLIENVVLRFPKQNVEYKILDIVTASYFTPTMEKKKAGNANNNEPILKITNNIERARELVIDGGENQVVGVICMQNNYSRKYGIELESLLTRRRQVFGWLIIKFEYNEWIRAFVDGEHKNFEILALTKDYLKKLDISNSSSNYMCATLNRELEIASNKNLNECPVNSPLSSCEYGKIKSKLSFILKHCFDDPSTIQFCRWAYGVLKFYNNTFFSMKQYEEENYDIMVKPIPAVINDYKTTIKSFAPLIRDAAEEVLKEISDLYEKLKPSSYKRDAIKDYFFEKNFHKVLFVVPNMRYTEAFSEYADRKMRFARFDWKVLPENKIMEKDCTGFDCVCYLSLMNTERNNPYNIIMSRNTIIFIYDNQKWLFGKMEKDFHDYKNAINSLNPFGEISECCETSEESVLTDASYNQEQELKKAFDESFLHIEMKEACLNSNYTGDTGMEAARFGHFETGEKFIFTKQYEAYVLDNENGDVKEKKVAELQSGDLLVFTINDSRTKDIVDELLQELCKKNLDIQKYYESVKRWKEELRQFKWKYNYTYQNLSNELKKRGFPITMAGIRGWIDEESHVVGPNKEEAFLHIARLVHDQEMEKNYHDYFSATKIVRTYRTKILKLIQKAVVADMNGDVYEEDGLFHDIIPKIKEVSLVKQIEEINDVKEKIFVAPNRANRPIED
uniref:DrmE family protein n=1 Tax=Eubacterium cellulosolvens TaxID=29322 RepID=UPI00048842F9|nr:DrmE family protein [[Eubacterium] cellulosolvens]